MTEVVSTVLVLVSGIATGVSSPETSFDDEELVAKLGRPRSTCLRARLSQLAAGLGWKFKSKKRGSPTDGLALLCMRRVYVDNTIAGSGVAQSETRKGQKVCQPCKKKNTKKRWELLACGKPNRYTYHLVEKRMSLRARDTR